MEAVVVAEALYLFKKSFSILEALRRLYGIPGSERRKLVLQESLQNRWLVVVFAFFVPSIGLCSVFGAMVASAFVNSDWRGCGGLVGAIVGAVVLSCILILIIGYAVQKKL